ncbi:hypothetical protein BVRB_1g012530 [Beta vulgaris subsp. vulgaris]|nr:hypothetical protein BVRB_1g012530 [Beta vulgaris subsp. vulgaris]
MRNKMLHKGEEVGALGSVRDNLNPYQRRMLRRGQGGVNVEVGGQRGVGSGDVGGEEVRRNMDMLVGREMGRRKRKRELKKEIGWRRIRDLGWRRKRRGRIKRELG